MNKQKKIGIVISGASGSLLALQALRLLDQLKATGTSLLIHLIITEGGRRTAALELPSEQLQEMEGLADTIHEDTNLAAPIASGSNALDGMLIIPCSIRSLSAVAYGQTDRLSIRAADVMLKERRPLVLAVRETPLHVGHLQAMQMVTNAGGIVAPPVPAFYLKPESVEQMANQNAARLLSLLGLDMDGLLKEWQHPDQDPT